MVEGIRKCIIELKILSKELNMQWLTLIREMQPLHLKNRI